MSDKLKKIKYNEHVQVPRTNFINEGDFMNYPLRIKNIDSILTKV